MAIKQPAVHDKTHIEKVEILAPPRFEPTGEVKTAKQAIADGNWLSSVNFWLYTRSPEPSLICQFRSPYALWEPGKLDLVAAAGHYKVGEKGLDGLHELHEELGVKIPKSAFQLFGRKLNVGVDAKGNERRWHITVYTAEYTGTIQDMKLQEYEVHGVFQVPLKPLMQVLHGELESFEVHGLDAHRQPLAYTITADCLPYNFDDYQQKMAEYIACKLGVDDAYLGN